MSLWTSREPVDALQSALFARDELHGLDRARIRLQLSAVRVAWWCLGFMGWCLASVPFLWASLELTTVRSAPFYALIGAAYGIGPVAVFYAARAGCRRSEQALLARHTGALAHTAGAIGGPSSSAALPGPTDRQR